MSKKLILGFALATLLISGPLISVHADNIGPMCWAGSCPDESQYNDEGPRRDVYRGQGRDTDQGTARDRDRYDRDFDENRYSPPVTPDPMGSPGY